MADRRIDQLTEAESIADGDLFVIWKENISKTRSIKMQTMGLATKNYVDSLIMLDLNNAIEITKEQLVQGFTPLTYGLITLVLRNENDPPSGSKDYNIFIDLKNNSETISLEIARLYTKLEGGGFRPVNIQMNINTNCKIKARFIDSATNKLSVVVGYFIPYAIWL